MWAEMLASIWPTRCDEDHQNRAMSVIAFHEKAGRSQVDSCLLLLGTFSSSAERTLEERGSRLGIAFEKRVLLPPLNWLLLILQKLEPSRRLTRAVTRYILHSVRKSPSRL
jgi:hypothetical protein